MGRQLKSHKRAATNLLCQERIASSSRTALCSKTHRLTWELVNLSMMRPTLPQGSNCWICYHKAKKSIWNNSWNRLETIILTLQMLILSNFRFTIKEASFQLINLWCCSPLLCQTHKHSNKVELESSPRIYLVKEHSVPMCGIGLKPTRSIFRAICRL